MPMIYRMPWLHAAGLLVLAIALAYWGWRIVRRSGELSMTTIVLWLLAGSVVAVKLPSYFLDEIRIDRERMQWQEGPWWARSEGRIEFSQLRSIRVEKQPGGSGRLKRIDTVWVVESLDGTSESHVVFGLWMEHYQEIRAQFTARGFNVPAPPA